MKIRWPFSRGASLVTSHQPCTRDEREARAAEQEWHDAELMARQAESRLEQAWAAHLSSGGGIPVAVITQARVLRMVATEKLAASVLRRTHGSGIQAEGITYAARPTELPRRR
jgi:hypothetical protein